MKALHKNDATKFEHIPNVGPRIAADFRELGLTKPSDLADKNPLMLYQRLCTLTGTRQDPCVLDTFMAAVDFMNGAPSLPWWHYTDERKKNFPNL